MRGGHEAVSVENRLTADQLAALSPGDAVTIESGAEFGRRRYATATVVRLLGSHIVVKCEGPRGGTFVERYGRQDGLRDGDGRAELIDASIEGPAAQDLRRRTQRIDALYREWSRRRSDDEALRQLHNAIGDYLSGASRH
jgi:hypothetical protein